MSRFRRFRGYLRGIALMGRYQRIRVHLLRHPEESLLNPSDQSFGDQSSLAVQDEVNLVVIGIGITFHGEKVWAGFPHRYRDVIESEGLRDCAGDAQKSQ